MLLMRERDREERKRCLGKEIHYKYAIHFT